MHTNSPTNQRQRNKFGFDWLQSASLVFPFAKSTQQSITEDLWNSTVGDIKMNIN